jgi:hypothetical protein
MAPVVPFPIAPIDPIKAAELAFRAAAWMAEVLQKRKNQRERAAAEIFHEMGLLVVWTRALNQAAHEVSRPLLRYSPTWSEAEKQAVFDAIHRFATDDMNVLSQLNQARVSLEQLSEGLWTGAIKLDQEIIDALHDPETDSEIEHTPPGTVAIGGKESFASFVSRARERIELPGAGDMYLNSMLGGFWAAMQEADAQPDAVAHVAAAVRDIAEWGDRITADYVVGEYGENPDRAALDMRELVDRAWATELDRRLGRLSLAVRLRYPKMPRAEWAGEVRAN